jgi:hypothetical protein
VNAGLNPAEGVNVRLLCLFVCCVGSGLCDALITSIEGSYRVCVCVCVCLVVCDLETSKRGDLGTIRALRFRKNKKNQCPCDEILSQPLLQWKGSKYYILCSLRYPACNASVPYSHLLSARLYYISPHYIIKGIFGNKRIEHKMCFDYFNFLFILF